MLYLFAGAKRKGSVKTYLTRLSKRAEVDLIMEEIDVLRGGRRHNALRLATRQRILKDAVGGQYDAVLASPPCCTFSRARHAGGRGPTPLRSSRYPRGFPWLSGAAWKTVSEANVLVDFTAEILQIQMRTLRRVGILEHPEDLGKLPDHGNKPGGCPASIWR